MAIFSLLYAAFGYLALLGAILWSMLFVADGRSEERRVGKECW